MLNTEMNEFAEKLRKPYPKRAASKTIDTSGVHPEKGGEAPDRSAPIPKRQGPNLQGHLDESERNNSDKIWFCRRVE